MNRPQVPSTFGMLRLLACLLSLLPRIAPADGVPPPNPKTAREALSDPNEVARWQNPKGFEKDVFTFVRLRYDVAGRNGRYNPH
ncbi:MAG: hypothetical protein RLZZ142_487, partial [Verrucomicrobiota bacterium]